MAQFHFERLGLLGRLQQLEFGLLTPLEVDVRSALRKPPDKVVVARQREAEVQAQVLPQADVERRSELARPQL